MRHEQVQEFFRALNPEKEVKIEFDDNCISLVHINYEKGMPRFTHQLEFHACKVIIEGQEPIYVPLERFTASVGWKMIKDVINSASKVFIPDEDLKEVSKLKGQEGYEALVNKLSDFCGISADEIKERAESVNV